PRVDFLAQKQGHLYSTLRGHRPLRFPQTKHIMKSSEDRRAVHVPRVPLVTLVDICTQGEDPAPFQAESANLSGRGMHVRTSYLPNIGEELVCRLEHAGQEVLVEGRVAWRSE